MRIAIAEVLQESDTFSPLAADLSEFESYGMYFGQDMLGKIEGIGALGGFLDVAAQEKGPIEIVPIMRACGNAGGVITADTFNFLAGKLLDGLKKALPLDGIFLFLHGAAASEPEDDVDGYLLQEVRKIVGRDMPIIVALDHHANITQKMVDHANALVGHETQPHDLPATGRKAARILFRTLHGEIKPAIRWKKIPMITPQDQYLTSAGPMKEWFDLARQMEQRKEVLDVSPYPMQPWFDAAEGGWAVVVHTDNDPELAQKLANEMANKAWSMRDAFWASSRVAPREAVRQAAAAERGLIILADTGDSVYGGAPGDSTVILRAMLEEKITCPAMLPMVDGEALRAAFAAGVGAQVTMDVGGKMDNIFSKPVKVTGKITALSRGLVVDMQDRGSFDLKRTALLQVGSISIALLEHRGFAVSRPELYAHLGLYIEQAKMVVVKTASNFQFFARWRQGLIRVDSPGTTQSDLTAFQWKRVPRPIYPLDPLPNCGA